MGDGDDIITEATIGVLELNVGIARLTKFPMQVSGGGLRST